MLFQKLKQEKWLMLFRKTIKELKYAKQDKFETQKELYKPITQELKKEIDEISDLRKDLIKPITYMQQQAIMGPGKQISDLNSGFNETDIKILEKHNLLKPHELFVTSYK